MLNLWLTVNHHNPLTIILKNIFLIVYNGKNIMVFICETSFTAPPSSKYVYQCIAFNGSNPAAISQKHH